MMAGFWYLATPYAKYSKGRQAAHDDACRVAATALRAGIKVFCPIAHTHNLSRDDILKDVINSHDFWLGLDRAFMEKAKGCIVVMMEGWEESRGVTEEIEYFRSTGKPIFYVHENETFDFLITTDKAVA